MRLEQQTHRHNMTIVLCVEVTQSRPNGGVSFFTAAATWNFPHRWIPQPLSSSENKAKQGVSDSATGLGCSFGGRVAPWPSVMCCAGNGNSKWLKSPMTSSISYKSADDNRMEKTLISLSDRAHKNNQTVWIYCLFRIVPCPLVFPRKVTGCHYETTVAVCNVETTSHQGLCNFHIF